MNARYAIYFVPEPGTALAAKGSALLGRDSETGLEVLQAELPGFSAARLRALTVEARRYGLHATLKAPFFLQAGRTEQELLAAADHFVMDRRAITLPRLELTPIGAFFALTPGRRTPEETEALQRVQTLAAEAVAFFDPFRTAPTEQELTRRGPEALSARQRELLAAWGYPYVFDEYRFHLTLTDALHDPVEKRTMGESLRAALGPVCDEPAPVAGICLCKQAMHGRAEPSARSSAFTLLRRVPLLPSGGPSSLPCLG